MIEAIFLLCALMSILIVFLLSRGYMKTRNRLLFWGYLSFAFLALSNLFICIDMIIYPNVDLNGPLIRNALTAISGSLLLAGLILEVK